MKLPGLTLTDIARATGHSVAAICLAVQRHADEPICKPVARIANIKFYRPDIAPWLKRRMREPGHSSATKKDNHKPVSGK